MSTNSNIEWTHHTFNGWWGCTKVHAGCKNCYAEATDARWGGDHWGNGPRRMILGEWGKPAQWNKAAKDAGEIHRVFCSSMCDVFEDYQGPVVDQQGKRVEFTGTDTLGVRAGQFDYENGKVFWSIDALRERVFRIIESTPNLHWLLLTKRPENITRMVPSHWLVKWPENVMTGTSPCDQPTAEVCIPDLLRVPGRHFLSCEPLIGAVDLLRIPNTSPPMPGCPNGAPSRRIDWVIVGGESGRGARPFHIKWARSLVAQCKGAAVPVFIKQLGARPIGYCPCKQDDGDPHQGCPTCGGDGDVALELRDHKGGDMSEWPEDLRVREFAP